MDWVMSYLPQVLMSLGVIALIVEVAVLGFATFILFFVGLAFVVTGSSMYFGWIEVSVQNAIWTNVILTLVFAIVLWKPFKKLQNTPTKQEFQSDFVQQEFVLSRDVDANSNDVFHAYSGVNWKVRSAQPIPAGKKVKAVKMEVGVIWVEPIND